MAEEIEPYKIDPGKYRHIRAAAVSAKAISVNVEAKVNVNCPQVFTGYSGQYHANRSQLVNMPDFILELRVFDTVGSDMYFPSTHPASVGFRFSFDKTTTEADVVPTIDCDDLCIPFRSVGRKS